MYTEGRTSLSSKGAIFRLDNHINDKNPIPHNRTRPYRTFSHRRGFFTNRRNQSRGFCHKTRTEEIVCNKVPLMIRSHSFGIRKKENYFEVIEGPKELIGYQTKRYRAKNQGLSRLLCNKEICQIVKKLFPYIFLNKATSTKQKNSNQNPKKLKKQQQKPKVESDLKHPKKLQKQISKTEVEVTTQDSSKQENVPVLENHSSIETSENISTDVNIKKTNEVDLLDTNEISVDLAEEIINQQNERLEESEIDQLEQTETKQIIPRNVTHIRERNPIKKFLYKLNNGSRKNMANGEIKIEKGKTYLSKSKKNMSRHNKLQQSINNSSKDKFTVVRKSKQITLNRENAQKHAEYLKQKAITQRSQGSKLVNNGKFQKNCNRVIKSGSKEAIKQVENVTTTGADCLGVCVADALFNSDQYKNIDEVAEDVCKKSAKMVAETAVRSVGYKTTKAVIKGAAPKLAKKIPALNTCFAVCELGNAVLNAKDIDDAVDKVFVTGVQMGLNYAAMTLGQAIIPIPGVGAFLGQMGLNLIKGIFS